MYATRRLSDLQKNPKLLAASPDGPNSGYLVIQDEESQSRDKSNFLEKLPFPQDKVGRVEYTSGFGFLFLHRVFFIPVLNRPLSHDCYYTILSGGKALTRSREGDMDNISICFIHFHSYFSLFPPDPKNLYQQLKINFNSKSNTFHATTLAREDFAPLPRRKDWRISFKTPKNNLELDATAQGLNPKLRARLPEFKPPLFQKPVVVGKWYSPYIFVKEGTLHEQVKRSMYYEVTLEQRWETIFAWINDDNKKSDGARRLVITNKSVLESEEVFIGGRKARLEEQSGGGVFWYTSYGGSKGKMKTRVGLRKEIVDRMNWEQERGGWVKDKVDVVDEYPKGGGGDWSQFGRYVLVERFNFRRLDGSLVMSFDFKHFNQMRTSFE